MKLINLPPPPSCNAPGCRKDATNWTNRTGGRSPWFWCDEHKPQPEEKP